MKTLMTNKLNERTSNMFSLFSHSVLGRLPETNPRPLKG
jgi:hypothetical protein